MMQCVDATGGVKKTAAEMIRRRAEPDNYQTDSNK
jgi:hypothetical protein